MTPRPLSRNLTFIMAVAIGVVVANLYYLQPLLHQVRAEFAVSTLATPMATAMMNVKFRDSGRGVIDSCARVVKACQ